LLAAASPPRDATGSLATALTHAERLLAGRPAAAAAQAQEILKLVPAHAQALLILGQALAATGDPAGAADALRRAVDADRDLAPAWRMLGDLALARGDEAGADAAYAQSLRAAARDPELLAAAVALCENRLPDAERALKGRLKQQPTDVAAIRMLAELATRIGRYTDAENLLARALELSPSFTGARHNYAVVLFRQGKTAEALDELAGLLAEDPDNPAYRMLQAAALATLGDYGEAIAGYERLTREAPGQPKLWLSLGHALKTAGRQADAIAAYRQALRLAPGLGEAWWSLANLKTVRLADAEIAQIQAQLARPEAGDDDRLHLHYALGKALEDAGEAQAAFDHYAKGARIRRAQVGYDAGLTHDQVARAKALFTPAFFAERAGQGAEAPDPIFIVGLPRSGSTLIEQILASHSAVEGTMELPEIAAISRRVSELGGDYPEGLGRLPGPELSRLGRLFLERTRVQRKAGKPFFIDKMPNNWAHLGLIASILPNAKIVDARRHPMATGFAAFKQHFARGQHFSYDLADLGRYWRDYADLMAHFDAVLPGRVHRVFYERMVEDTEGEVRRLLAYCGLPFEEACLRFYETERAVRTASSEQVRRPIYREGLDQWRRFEPWLGPLADALGDAVSTYPERPE